MQPIKGEKGVHFFHPTGEVEALFDANIFSHGVNAWQGASEEVQQQYLGFEMSRDDARDKDYSLKEYCKQEYQDAALSAMFRIAGKAVPLAGQLFETHKPNTLLRVASYVQCKTFGIDASAGDLYSYFYSHPEHDMDACQALVQVWWDGNNIPLLAFLYARMAEAAEMYQAVLHKYGDHPLERVEYDQKKFLPLSDVLDTEYFLLHALIELVEGEELSSC